MLFVYYLVVRADSWLLEAIFSVMTGAVLAVMSARDQGPGLVERIARVASLLTCGLWLSYFSLRVLLWFVFFGSPQPFI